MREIEEARRGKPRPESRERAKPARREPPSVAAEPRPARQGMVIPPAHKRLRNIRLVIEYDGSRFAGWQVQPKSRTVAGVVEKALAEIVGEDVRLVGAGRTDEGVHAEGQVANFLTRWKLPAGGLAAALNDRLPDDVAVIEAGDVGPEFHARHSATNRVYRYHVIRRPSVFMRRRSWHVTKPLDVTLLREAADMIVGMHDFAAFADLRLHQERSTKVDVTYAGWKEAGPQLIFRIGGSHFLPRMVRRLVGCIVRVGAGDLPLATFRSWLDSGRGESGPMTAPSMGLYLEHVEYPAEILKAPRDPPWRARERINPVAQRAVEALERGSAEIGGAQGWQVERDGV